MPVTVLKINAVYPPEGQKKYGAVLGRDSSNQNMRLSVPRESLHFFSKGDSPTIEYDVVPGNQPGKSFFNFLRMADQQAPNGAGIAPSSEALRRQLAQAEAAEAQAAQQQKQQHDEQYHEWLAREREKSMWMAVVGCMSRASGNGAKPEDLKDIAVAAVDAFKLALVKADGYDLSGLQASTVAAGGAPIPPNTEEGDPGFQLDDSIQF